MQTNNCFSHKPRVYADNYVKLHRFLTICSFSQHYKVVWCVHVCVHMAEKVNSSN